MSKSRVTIAALSLSAAAFVGILAREGYTDHAVIPTQGDVPTVGFGTTEGVKMGETITPVKAAQRALKDAAGYEGALKRCVHVPLSQDEYDVYVDLAYNIGPTNFCTNRQGAPSTLVTRLNAGNYAGACEAILQYRYAAGYDCSTLVNGQPNKRCWGVWQRRLELNQKCMGAQ